MPITLPFSLIPYVWRSRPLLVFAPSREDDRYIVQRRMVDQAALGFERRDLVWFGIFEEGQCIAPDYSIHSSDAERLRERFGIRYGGFGVQLIGKDGSVKLSSDRPVPEDALFDVIDQMPLRQREMQMLG